MKFKKNIILIILLIIGFKNNFAMEARPQAPDQAQEALAELRAYLDAANTSQNPTESKEQLKLFKDKYNELREKIIHIVPTMNYLESNFENLVKVYQARKLEEKKPVLPTSFSPIPGASPSPMPTSTASSGPTASTSTAPTHTTSKPTTGAPTTVLEKKEITLNVLIDDPAGNQSLPKDLQVENLLQNFLKEISTMSEFKFKLNYLKDADTVQEISNGLFLYTSYISSRISLGITDSRFANFYNKIYGKTNPGKLILLNFNKKGAFEASTNIETLESIDNGRIKLKLKIPIFCLDKRYYNNEGFCQKTIREGFIKALKETRTDLGTFEPIILPTSGSTSTDPSSASSSSSSSTSSAVPASPMAPEIPAQTFVFDIYLFKINEEKEVTKNKEKFSGSDLKNISVTVDRPGTINTFCAVYDELLKQKKLEPGAIIDLGFEIFNYLVRLDYDTYNHKGKFSQQLLEENLPRLDPNDGKKSLYIKINK